MPIHVNENDRFRPVAWESMDQDPPKTLELLRPCLFRLLPSLVRGHDIRTRRLVVSAFGYDERPHRPPGRPHGVVIGTEFPQTVVPHANRGVGAPILGGFYGE